MFERYFRAKRILLAAIGIWLVVARVPVDAQGQAELHPLREPLIVDLDGSAGVARNADGEFFVTSTLSYRIARFSPELRFLGFLEPDVVDPGHPALDNFPDIASNPARDTFFLLRGPIEILEMENDGTLTDFSVTVEKIPGPPTNAGGVPVRPFITSIAFNPVGNGGAGSFWVLEAITTAIFEIFLSGGGRPTILLPSG